MIADVRRGWERPGGGAPKIAQPTGRVGTSRRFRCQTAVRGVRPDLIEVLAPALDDEPSFGARTREIELDAPGWAVIGYSRARALQERAVLPVTFGALDGEATWRAEEGLDVGPHRLAAAYPTETTRPALFTALRTGFAEALLREAFVAIRDLRARRRQERGLAPGEAAPGLGKLLVVAPDQENARRYLELVRGWIPVCETAPKRDPLSNYT